MRLFRQLLFGLAAPLAVASAASFAAVPAFAQAPVMARTGYARSPAKRFNGKRKSFTRKRRPNRLHISRRVRRKHRRSA